MINIIHRSKLEGANRFGTCASCVKERDVYKISFEDEHGNNCSISLCKSCLKELENMIHEI
ncbi:hypothetical protein HMPREF1215_00748 [Coprococcus sp. HPP0074]|jgi:hypothetical protein|nr:hypothetical protein HMPREF1215_00748 [Coprococcus sp. HPP0074]